MAKAINAGALKEAIDRGRGVQLVSISLVEMDAHRRGVKSSSLPEKGECKVESQAKLHGQRLIVAIKISLDVRYNQKDESPAIHVRAAFVLEYSSSGVRMPADVMGQFARTTAHLNVWPFWRELVQSTTTRMGLPAVPVPLLNFGQFESKAPPAKIRPSRRKAGRRR